jgi:hypothetical protein
MRGINRRFIFIGPPLRLAAILLKFLACIEPPPFYREMRRKAKGYSRAAENMCWFNPGFPELARRGTHTVFGFQFSVFG